MTSTLTNTAQGLQLATRLGVPMAAHLSKVQGLDLHDLKIIDLLPQMLVMIRSLIAQEAVAFRRAPITVIAHGLLISFQNAFADGREGMGPLVQEQPHVRVMPLHLASEVHFPKHAHSKQVTIVIEAAYLQALLGEQRSTFAYLFDAERTFWLEDCLSPAISSLVDELVNAKGQVALPDFYFRLKVEALLYHLFDKLSQRATGAPYPVSAPDIEAIYRVRNAMAASLQEALPVGKLLELSGMTELKLRKLFTQVFGKGLYAYYQQLRMQEAARLLKEEQLSVSETGYRLGFSNLSHFGRLFEEHFGMKPKKWSSGQRAN
jgi:AraC-like DNA-binding protein